MKFVKLFENFNRDIDEVYIKELIEEFCLENDIYYAKEFYNNLLLDNILDIDEKEYNLLLDNILDRNVLICNFGKGGINFNLFVYVGYRKEVWSEIKTYKLNRLSETDIFNKKFPVINKEFNKLINLIVRSIKREGFFVKPSNLVFSKGFWGFDEEIFLFQIINKIEYHKK